MDGTGNPHGVTLSLTSGTLNLNGTQQILDAWSQSGGTVTGGRGSGITATGQSTTYSNNATLTAGHIRTTPIS